MRGSLWKQKHYRYLWETQNKDPTVSLAGKRGWGEGHGGTRARGAGPRFIVRRSAGPLLAEGGSQERRAFLVEGRGRRGPAAGTAPSGRSEDSVSGFRTFRGTSPTPPPTSRVPALSADAVFSEHADPSARPLRTKASSCPPPKSAPVFESSQESILGVKLEDSGGTASLFRGQEGPRKVVPSRRFCGGIYWGGATDGYIRKHRVWRRQFRGGREFACVSSVTAVATATW